MKNIQTHKTIMDILKLRSTTQPDKISYRFLSYSGKDPIEKSITYRELDRKARAIAAYLQKNNVSGKCAILLYPGGLDFITAFFGCLYADVIAVPLYHFISKRRADRIKAVIEDSQAKIFLSDSSNIESVSSFVNENYSNDEYTWLATDTIDDKGDSDYTELNTEAGKLAYLQYTSGSTSSPKGVMITHKNILHNTEMLSWHFKSTVDSVGVSWLPHFHDMGLVAMILQPLYVGYPQILMQPSDFLAQPYRFLKAISDYKGTTIGAPNFSFDHCVTSVTDEQLKTLDLSSLDIAYNGAEPVHWSTIENFNQKFKPCGLKPDVHIPAYGMAESTLIITSRFPFPENRLPVYMDIDKETFEKENKAIPAKKGKDSIRYVSDGRFRDDVRLIIVDAKNLSVCPDGSVGEVWIAYDSVSPGYWNKEKETKETFQAYTSDTSEGPFLRTGDLGFVVDGELYLCGRLKDILIIRGTNYYPNDIEYTVGHCHEALVPDSSAAFSLEIDNEEKLFVAQEIKRTHLKDVNPEEIFNTIREVVADVHGLQVYGILLLRFGHILKTSSGKIQRKRCKESYLTGELEILHKNIVGKETDKTLSPDSAFAQLLKLPVAERRKAIMNNLAENIAILLKINQTQVFKVKKLITLGMDSFSVSVLKQKIDDQYNYPVTIAEIYNFSLEELADLISSHLPEFSVAQTGKIRRLPQIKPDKENRFKEFPLTDLQHAYWIGRHGAFELGGFGTHAYFEITAEGYELDYNRLNIAWQKLIERHDMLHAVFTPDANQRILEEIPKYNIQLINLQAMDENGQKKVLEELRNTLSHQIFSYDQWPLFDIRMTKLKPGKSIIHISIDLLIADIWSLNSLFMEWKLMYDEKYAELPSIDVSFRDYSLTMNDVATTEVYQKAAAYWKERIASLPPAPQLPQVKSVKDLKEIRFNHRLYKLPLSAWTSLKEKAVKYAVTPTVLVMAVFAKLMSNWSRSNRFSLNLTLFNRLGLHPDINNVIGDFTSSMLVEVDNSKTLNFKELVLSLQDQLARDMEYRHYSGINVIRDIILKNKESSMKPLMPIVFTTALSGDTKMVFNSPTTFFGKNTFTTSQTSQVWLDNQIYENEDYVAISWDAIDELFPPGMLDDMFAVYTSLVKQVAEDESVWEKDIRTLIPARQLRQRAAFNTTGNEAPNELLITKFLANAKKTPEAPAIFTSCRRITYRQLANSAAIIAQQLKAFDVKQGELVAVRMLKGWEQIVGAVGVLLAGGAYLSIDPGLPEARQKYIIEHGQARIILTTSKTPRNIDVGDNINYLEVDETILTKENVTIPVPPQSPDDPAYVLYTSGSTGQPKGAMLSHRNALNTIIGVNELFDVTAADRTFAISSLSFDLSVYDVFGMLYAGGSMVIPDPGTDRNPDHWFSLVDQYQVTIWNSVPALMELLIENVETYNKKLNFRSVFLSGDWIPVNLPEKIWKINQDIKVISLGGPTECAIWQAWYPIEYIDGAWKSIPYGKPLPNQRIYIMNEHLGECPDWVPGELYIGGTSVGINYFRDEVKSAQSFIMHPETKERLYKSGDLGRFIPNPGYIEFLGREDFQVKIGGFRIELGEIETVLNENPKVRRVAVKKIENKKGNTFLAAYVVLNTLGKLELQKSNAKSETNLAEEIVGDGETKLLLDQEDRLAFKLSDPGLRKIDGPAITLDTKEENIMDRYIKRGNSRRFLNKPISKLTFSRFLSCLKKVDYEGLKKYQYGSAGGLYPVQIYIYVKDDMVEGLSGGSYYYNPIKHQLIELSSGNGYGHEIHVPTNHDIFKTSSFTIFLIGKMPAIKPFYGIKARDFCLIEAGLITQLLEMAGVGTEIGLCQIGAVRDEDNIRKLLKLEDEHILLHTIMGGLVDYSDHLRGLPLEKENSNSSKNGDNKLSEELKDYCKKKLPHYMVPNIVMFLDNLPLTAANKVNYKALPEPVLETAGAGVTSLQPQNELEKIIYRIFSEQSGVENPDVNVSLFEMGINSLTVIKIWRAIVSEIKIDFPVTRIFENPTISGLVKYLVNQNVTDEEKPDEVDDKVSKKKEALKKRLVVQQSRMN